MAAYQTLVGSVASLALVLVILSAACVASETTMQGASGEYCNGFDNDCQAPLVCQDFICVFPDDFYGQECEAICHRTEDCGVTIDNCQSSCTDATRQWGRGPIDAFVSCFTDDLSCEELEASDNPPQTCYRRLEIPEGRAVRCQAFVDASRDCGADAAELDELNDECRFMARTRSDAVWANSDTCADIIANGVCNDVYHCLNQTFQLDDPGLPATGEPNDTPVDVSNQMNDLNNFVDGSSG